MRLTQGPRGVLVRLRVRVHLGALLLVASCAPASPSPLPGPSAAMLGPEAPARTVSRPTQVSSEPTQVSSEPTQVTPADYERHVQALRARLGPEFTILVEPPFVVAGDSPPRDVERQTVDIVRWAVRRLKAAYFPADPDKILDIFLFRSPASYGKNTLALFNEKPSTPFGYYSSAHKALVMDISTGGGTLVHEIVHPFVEANFPEAPAWLNEGLGSLYEQSGDEAGQIHGYPNWRLPGLQAAIRRGAVPSFEPFMAQTEHQFYDEDPGTNYGQARYLCYYLQEKGLLGRYYRELFAHRREDPSGYATLRRVLGDRDMDAWKRDWERFVGALRFP